MKKLVLLFLSCCFMISLAECGDKKTEKEITGVEAKKYEPITYYRSIVYFKDKKAGLCYAKITYGDYITSITNVPCTPEVEELLANKN